MVQFKYAMKLARELFGPLPADRFAPKAIESVRDRMIENGWCRRLIINAIEYFWN
jgi:hypothetical protein